MSCRGKTVVFYIDILFNLLFVFEMIQWHNKVMGVSLFSNLTDVRETILPTSRKQK